MDVQTILLIILSIGFAVLLLLGIIMAVIFIKIMTNVRHITEKVDETTANLNQVTGSLIRKAAPAAMSALGALLWSKAKSKIRRK